MLILTVLFMHLGARAMPIAEALSACRHAQPEAADAELDMTVRLERRLVDPKAGAFDDEQFMHLALDDARIRQSVAHCVDASLRQVLPVTWRIDQLEENESLRAVLDNFAIYVGTFEDAELDVVSASGFRRAHFVVALRELQNALTNTKNPADTVGTVLERFTMERERAVEQRRQWLPK